MLPVVLTSQSSRGYSVTSERLISSFYNLLEMLTKPLVLFEQFFFINQTCCLLNQSSGYRSIIINDSEVTSTTADVSASSAYES